MTAIHPALVLLGTAAVVSVARGRLRQIVLIFGAVASLVAVSALVPEADWAYPVSGVSLQLLRVDPLSRLFGLIVSLITVIGVVYSLHVRRSTEHVAILLYRRWLPGCCLRWRLADGVRLLGGHGGGVTGRDLARELSGNRRGWLPLSLRAYLGRGTLFRRYPASRYRWWGSRDRTAERRHDDRSRVLVDSRWCRRQCCDSTVSCLAHRCLP